jgi:hypothetical protein
MFSDDEERHSSSDGDSEAHGSAKLSSSFPPGIDDFSPNSLFEGTFIVTTRPIFIAFCSLSAE